MVARDNICGEGELMILSQATNRFLVHTATALSSIATVIGILYIAAKPYVVTAEDMKFIQSKMDSIHTKQQGQIAANTEAIQQTTETVSSLHTSVLEGRIDDLQDKMEDLLVVPEDIRTQQQKRALVKYQARIRKLERKLDSRS